MSELFVGIDLATTPEKTAIVVMERSRQAQTEIIKVLEPIMIRHARKTVELVKIFMLPKAKNRSARVAKKMVKRLFPPVEIRF